ncbi:TRAP transporter small permease subunit [Gammaproteobacteria bacterium LSUCC0057]|uniref:TRAP transporter small permease protein n=1 Tax=Gammaproteobacteria bacterium LSUCC0057 TaxID=2559237 RepID=A0A4Y8UJI0_9GAMM|nr:TRAP transporter small permease subunit [Gammaproteobacteria bacterium LSUCC0057]
MFETPQLAAASAWLRGIFAVARTLRALLERLGALVSWLVLAMALLTAVVVVLRYFFQFGSIALQESVTYLHAAVFMLGAAYAAQRDQHVRVDIFYRHFARRTQLLVNVLGTLLLLLPVTALLFFYSFDYVAASWALAERSSDSGGLAFRYLLKSLLLLLPLLMWLHAVVLLVESGLEWFGYLQAPEQIGTEGAL